MDATVMFAIATEFASRFSKKVAELLFFLGMLTAAVFSPSRFTFLYYIFLIITLLATAGRYRKREDSILLVVVLLFIAGFRGVIEFKSIVHTFIYYEIMFISLLSIAVIDNVPIRDVYRYALAGALGSILILLGISLLMLKSFELGSIMLLVGLSAEALFLPLGVWAPELYKRASILFCILSSCIAAEVALIWAYYTLEEIGVYNIDVSAFIFALTCILSVPPMFYERSIRRILAYSSMVNSSSALLLLSNKNVLATFLMYHSVSKAAAFSLVPRSKERVENLAQYGSPLLALSLFSLAGIPPLLGFYAKLAGALLLAERSILFIIAFLLPHLLLAYPYLSIACKCMACRRIPRDVTILSFTVLLIVLSIVYWVVLCTSGCLPKVS